MKLIRLSLVLFCVFLSLIIQAQTGLHAQKGIIRGIIVNDITGETMPGVNVVVEGTTTGSVTDLDGKFNLTVEPGTYSLKMSFVSFETVVINNVLVKDNDVTSFNNIRLKETVNQLNQVVITAEMARN